VAEGDVLFTIRPIAYEAARWHRRKASVAQGSGANGPRQQKQRRKRFEGTVVAQLLASDRRFDAASQPRGRRGRRCRAAQSGVASAQIELDHTQVRGPPVRRD